MRHLKSQTKLYRYTIRKQLSAGGFGIVYLANRDDGLLVAIKEYMPAYIKNRDQELNIQYFIDFTILGSKHLHNHR